MAIEIVVRAGAGAPEPPGDRVPEALMRYSHAFLTTSRDHVRFLWRADTRWLAVGIHRDPVDRGSNASTSGRATLRVAEIDLPAGVTAREVDVLTLLALGLTNQGIAARLGTSSRTVSTQIERLLVKLGQGTRGGLAALAVDSGLLRLPVPGGAGELDGLGIVELERAVSGLAPRQVVPTTARYARRTPLRLGTLVPGGTAVADGAELLHGAELAIEELNAMGGVGGRRLELHAVDVDLFDWDSVSAGLTEVFSREVDAITTSYTTAPHGEMLDRVADYGRPLLHTATFEEQVQVVRNDPSRYGAIFQTCPSETHYGTALLRLLAELEERGLWRPRSRRIATIEADLSGLGVTTTRFLEDADKAGWGVDDVVRVPLAVDDWRPVLERLARHDPDIIMVAHVLDQELTELHRAIIGSRIRAMPYYVYGASIPRFQQSLGTLADGVIWSTTTGTYDDVIGQSFRQRYHSRFGVLPGWSQASSSYDQVQLLASAWSATNSREPADVVRYLRRVPYRGVNGVYYLGGPGQSSLSYPDTTPEPTIGQAHMIYQIQGDTHRVLGPAPFGSAALFQQPSWCVDGGVA